MVAPSRIARRRRPASYPSHLERPIEVSGKVFRVRPIVPGDSDHLAEEFSDADPETLRLRFFTSRPKLGAEDFEHLATVDYKRRLALTAWDGQLPAAIARYEYLDDATAEVAFVVKPDYRNLGLGRRLVNLLAAEAAANGYAFLKAIYLAENRAAAASLERAGFEVVSREDGMVEATRRL